MVRKLRPGWYVAEAQVTDSSARGPRYVVFRWTTDMQALVNQVRRNIRRMQQTGRWYTVGTGPGPAAKFFEALPCWVYELAGLRDVLDTGAPVLISRVDGERLISIEDDNVAAVDCTHITVNDHSLYVGAYGRYCGTHWETTGLIREDG